MILSRFLPILLISLFVAAPAMAKKSKTKRATAQEFNVKDIKGKQVKLEDLKGKVVVINFWATWCRPCMQELGFLNKFQKKYKKKGFVVLAVSTDGPETASKIASVVRRKRLKMPVIHDKAGTLTAAFNPRATNPFSVFIDKEGKIASVHEGYASGDEKKHEKLIKSLLAE